MNKTPKERLIDSLREKGFSDSIVNSFDRVRRENFVPENVSTYAYEDIPLPIEDGSTISQPSTLAFILSLLELKQNHKVLEIGSGTGYMLALIYDIIKDGKIYGLEINKKIAIISKKILSHNSNIQIINRSGRNGLPEYAPYDRILISASCPDLSIPLSLVSQLSENGIIVAAVKQSIYKITKNVDSLTQKEYPGFVFVPFKNDD